MIFITDVHGDHMNMKTLKELDISKTTIISPSAVFSKLTSLAPKNSIVINNGESKDLEALKVDSEALRFARRAEKTPKTPLLYHSLC